MNMTARHALMHLENWYCGRELFPNKYLKWTTLGLIYHDRSLNNQFSSRGFPLEEKHVDLRSGIVQNACVLDSRIREFDKLCDEIESEIKKAHHITGGL